MKNVESSKRGKTQHPRKSICEVGEVWRSVHPLTKRTKLQSGAFCDVGVQTVERKPV